MRLGVEANKSVSQDLGERLGNINSTIPSDNRLRFDALFGKDSI